MLAKIQRWFENKVPSVGQEIDQHQLQLAAAVLLIEIARADFEDDDVESLVIRQALSNAFELSDTEAHELFLQAQNQAEETISLYQFTRIVNDHCSEAEKLFLMQQLWRVAYADGRIDKYEDYTIRKLADLLYISHRDFMQAKHSVMPTVL